MDLLTEKQIGELIVEYENKVKSLIEKIKGELQNRKELKKKIEEAKQREALQLQILDRLEESEKLVRKQIDLVAKMEDNESLRQRELIKKYKQMLDEQKSTWQKYKEEYESLPSVKKIRQAEAKYMCASIKHRLVLKKIKDAQRMVQLRELVKIKQEQALIIKFAQLMLDYMKRQKHCQELWNLNRKLTAQAQQLRQQLQEKENSKNHKLDAQLQKASALMKPQQLPQVDLSHFIIHRNKRQDKLDTMSVNSYILEEEYINNNGQSSEKLNSSQTMDVDVQETMEMEIDTQETNSQEREPVQSNEPPKRLDFKGASDNEGKTQSTPPVAEYNDGEHNKAFDGERDNQERHPLRKPMSQMQQQNKENSPLNVNFANDGNVQNEYSTPYQRPISTSAKMSKSSFQEKHPHSQTSKQNTTRSSFQDKHLHNQTAKHQEMMQQQQNSQASKRSLRENQQQQSSSRNSSQDMYEQQVSRQSSQEMYEQQVSRQSSQEKYQQQQQQVYQQNQQQQQVYQQNQQQQQVYQQNQQQQSSHYPPQEIYQQKQQQQQETYLQNEQRIVLHQQMQVSTQNSEQMDFSRLPSASKPRIISNEYVNYNLQDLNVKRSSKHQPPVESKPQTLSETSRNTAPMPKTESTPFAYQVPFAHGVQSSVNVTPMSAIIEPSSMMSTTMHSADNSYIIPDNISAIIGSEITEPGGSFELARRLYDSDLNSEDGEIDIDKFMRNACSPIHNISPKVQHPQPPKNTSTQPPVNNSTSQNTQDSSERAFTFGAFAKKPTNTTHRFF